MSLNLVYNVKPLPESMFNCLWNYDKLEEKDEAELIIRILIQTNNEKGKEWQDKEIEHIAFMVAES